MERSDNEKRVNQIGSELTELKADLRQLQARAERHSLVIQALKEMLLARSEYTEAEFLERLAAAGAKKAAEKNCPKCGKAMNPKHRRCMYCGEERPEELL
jgi:hypothetical protein